MDFEQSSHATPAMNNLIERHDPWEALDEAALAIIDETYAAALDIIGGAGVAVVEVKAAARAPDSDSPVVTVHSSATHCLVALNNNNNLRRRRRRQLPRALVSVSPGTLFLSRSSSFSGDDARPPSRDAAAGRGVTGILDMIVRRLGEAIRREEAILIKAMASGLRGPKVDEIFLVRNVMDEMRREMDLPALMRRIAHKRRDVTEIACRPAAAAATEEEEADETERMMKKLRLTC
uniref:Uncharacterized protein n=1 Tax=Leersia perrieri TaxID=77586 RepID=A0A0D9XEA6_9ORYZ